MSFLLATLQTVVDGIFVTYSLMGLVFAVIRTVSGLVTGLAAAGWLTGMPAMIRASRRPPACQAR
jgi:uncharacterized membrane protein YraQ (UPF0718 family)